LLAAFQRLDTVGGSLGGRHHNCGKARRRWQSQAARYVFDVFWEALVPSRSGAWIANLLVFIASRKFAEPRWRRRLQHIDGDNLGIPVDRWPLLSKGFS